jgi:hypothetical protein
MDCLLAGNLFEPAQNGIAVQRIAFDQPSGAARPLSRDQCSAGATEWIEHDLTPPGAVLYRLCDQRHRLDSWMQSEVFAAAGGVDPRIVPDIGSISPAVTEPESIGVARKPVLRNIPIDAEAVTSPWSGWPPQRWIPDQAKVDGGDWHPIPIAELLVEQENELRHLRWLARLRSGADG